MEKQQNDIKCYDHPQNDLVLICLSCQYKPACIKCVVGDHKGHIFEDIENLDFRDDIDYKFQDEIIPKLNEQLENNKNQLEKSENNFAQIKDSHEKNLEKLMDEFKKIKDFLIAKENDLKRLLITKFDENLEPTLPSQQQFKLQTKKLSILLTIII
ncbi:hypothetical protein DICPUDRAFT_149365 [Dictyostelium purpureum]|uniref:B box-type domain-containing protein n=1 Tax=Dictyostelium purpureum TaxID=5786 RepID=F0ZDI5_DICPU|nr:uncharacterized protein DICPUDRAFT_149365 [Dictyostelium purpureum]EGC37987.1 hypothetical protein DICPUDRAFT_149365 [Dictyostelium purpureum]|eukprot:XP_003285471.1 hypothetical protein DICPUDRAFT_149365 [Dictyostelium purpureum]